MMLCSRPAVSLTRTSIRNFKPPTLSRAFVNAPQRRLQKPQLSKWQHQRPHSLAISAYRPFSTSLLRLQDVSKPISERKFEEQHEHEKLEADPEIVSSTSSIHPVFGEVGEPKEEKEEDMMGEIKSDLKTIKETFALNEVPKEAFQLGLAGLIPYAATSLTTCYLAWDINHADISGHGFLLSGETATQVLGYIEPLQIGYGAVIISFLGAIHWGLEWAGFGGHHGLPRYAYGVLAPAFAWPTTFMPFEYALISQFLTFAGLYYADAQATVNGWVPHWYSSYRFVLTFVVGASIVLSLVGRGQIVDKLHRLPSPTDRVQKLKGEQLEMVEKEERYKQEQALHADEEDEDEEAEEEEDAAEEE